ncbi:MAG: amino acid adenylation domain-containing protein [Sulfurimonas sp.]|nr:amino acid adenylation domain-containing protein [Sulfurimonas sp.]
MQISIYQERFLLEWLLNPKSSKYNVSLSYKLDNSVNLKYLEKACKYALDDENFYISFNKENKPYRADYSLNDFITYIEYDEDNIKEYLIELINKPFDIYNGPLYKYYIITTNSNIYLLSVAYHILADAITANTLNRRLENFYNHLCDKNTHIDLTKESFCEAVEIEHSLITKEKKESAKEYWLEFLNNYPLNVDFPISTYTNTTSKSEVLYLELQGDEYINLKKAVRKSRTTLFQYITAVYSLVISKITNQEEIILSYPINLRPKTHANVTGSFVNNVLLKANVTNDISFNDLIVSLNKQRKSSKEHLWYSLNDIVENLREERTKDIGDNFFNISIGEAVFSGSTINLSGVHAEGMMDVSWSKESDALLSLQFDATSDKDRVIFQLEYQCEKVDPLLMKKFLNHFENTLNDVASTPEIHISDITLLDKEEYQQLVYTNNQTDKEYPDFSLHELFVKQAQLTPDNIALVYEEKSLTYKELDSLTNSLAREIQAEYKKKSLKTLQADTPIALCLDRSLDMIIAIIATLKAGAAYVPIDPNYPDERITYILEDTKTALLLTQSHLKDKLDTLLLEHESINNRLSLLAIDEYNYQTQDDRELISISTPDSLAYVIYTSGTTGKPKGVMIEHGGVVNLAENQIKEFGITDKDNILQFASYSFDAATLEIYTALIYGAVLVITSSAQRENISELIELIIKQEISFALLPPVLLRSIEYKSLPKLKTLLVGGEACSKDVMDVWSKDRTLVNAYGPTESTVYATLHKYKTDSLHTNIGRPINNTRLYILNESLIPVPEGVTGELYIAGAGVARGYLNQEELTKERFLPNPFARRRGDRDKAYTTMYKTGDLVRLLADNNIEYIGRNDFQVKIRGYRIELPEIESIISNCSGVKQAVVLAKEHNNSKYLVAYYTTTQSINEKQLISFLTKELPEYMVPSAFIKVEAFELTVNGKLNTKALPEPEFKSESYEAPTSELQEKLCEMFQDVLKLERVGINDDFFKIGGNSILAISLANKLSCALSLEVKVADIFTFKTIEHLIKNGLHHNRVHIPVTHQDKTPLSFAQQRLYFIDKYEDGSNAYNIPMTIELLSTTDIEIFKQAISSIVNNQDILRTLIKEDSDANIYQELSKEELIFHESTFESKEMFDAKLSEDVNRIFDLNSELPIYAAIYRVDEGIYMLINIHHIAFDGWSMKIFFKELYQYYNHYKNSTTLEVPIRTLDYKDFASWQKDYLQEEELQTQYRYWENKLQDVEPLTLVTDYQRPKTISYEGDSYYISLDDKLSLDLSKLAKENGVTPYTLLLSAFNVLLFKYSNQEDITVGSPTASRHFKQLEDIIGVFVNTLAIRNQINSNESFNSLLDSVEENVIQAQSHQDIPFEHLVDRLDIERDISRHPIFDIMFTLQNFMSRTTDKDKLFSIYDSDSYKVAKFDLELSVVHDDDESLHLLFNYATSLFKLSTIQMMASRYIRILEQIVFNPYIHISDITLLDQEEYKQLVYINNQTDKEYPHSTIHELFTNQAALTPDNIALVYEEKSLTYKELDSLTNSLAREIQAKYKGQSSKELQADTPIALCLDRSLDMIIAIIAILKSGGAYVPIDPSYPDERITYILEDTNTALLLTQSHLKDKLDTLILEHKSIKDKLSLLAVDEYNYETQSSTELPSISTQNSLAYIIYTSGTTGKPKGVMIEHGGVVNLLSWYTESYEFNDESSTIIISSLSFDLTQKNIFSMLKSGGKIVLPSSNHLEANEVHNLISKHQCTFLNCAPSAFYTLVEPFMAPYESLKSLKYLFLGGESIDFERMNLWLDSTTALLVNSYGPTECSDVVSSYTLNKKQLAEESIPIGRPVYNTRLYVLDNNLNLVPKGVTGELYIAGAGVARGYLNQEELTQERFLPNPFARRKDGRDKGNTVMYKTGDLVRLLEDNNIEYIGRNDFQVKIRGYRIELPEIESIISSYDGVKQAVVLAKEHNNSKYLVAYYTVNKSINEKELIKHLTKELPEYMVPSAFIEVDAFELTVNGKLNTKVLPDPEFKSESYEAPTSELQEKLCDVFKEVLKVERVGISDNFFKIGGNSILAISLAHKLSNALSLEVRVSDIFRMKTVLELIDGLINNHSSKVSLIKPYSNHYNETLPKLIFIHPGRGGCEVYQPLADKLSETYTCIGIDNHNIHSSEKIDNINLLASYYLDQYKKQYQLTEQISICAWSIGGKIALEMAYLLEKKGYKNINIIILDTILVDENIKLMVDRLMSNNKYENQLKESMYKNYDKEYVDKVFSATEAENALSTNPLSGKLEYSNVTLLKAMQADTIVENEEYKRLSEYTISLESNNISPYSDNLTIHELDCTHSNILDNLDINEFLRV